LPSPTITVALGLLGAETLLGAVYTVEHGELFWTRPRVAAPGPDDAQLTRLKLSPVYGYNFRPGFRSSDSADVAKILPMIGEPTLPDFWRWPANNYGFISDVDYPYAGPPDTFYAIIVGGSPLSPAAVDRVVAAFNRRALRGRGEPDRAGAVPRWRR
jgi:hypothetical protein